MTDPQTWNGYAYVRNSPLNLIDPSGMDAITFSVTGYCGMSCIGGSNASSPQPNIGQGLLGDPALAMAWTGLGGTGYWGPLCLDCGTSLFSTTTYFHPPSAGASSDDVVQPPATGNTNPNLPTPTIFKLTIPGTNYCGPGGNGVPSGRVDAACAKHDRCYENAGVSFVNNVGWPKTAQQTAAIKACNANLSGDLMRIYFPTSAEAGQATIVSTYFNLPSGYNLRP